MTNSDLKIPVDIYTKDKHLLWIKYKSDINIGFAEAKIIANEIIKKCNGKSHYFIIDARDYYGDYTGDARKYMANHPELIKLRKAYAILVNNLGSRLIANFYMKFEKPTCPGKVFNEENKAIDWLKHIRLINQN